MIEDKVSLEDIYNEIKFLRKEVKDLKAVIKEDDLTNFVLNLEKNNLLGTKEEAEKVGLEL